MKKENKRNSTPEKSASRRNSSSRDTKRTSVKKGTGKRRSERDPEKTTRYKDFSFEEKTSRYPATRGRKKENGFEADNSYSSSRSRKRDYAPDENDNYKRRKNKEDESSGFSKKRSYSSGFRDKEKDLKKNYTRNRLQDQEETSTPTKRRRFGEGTKGDYLPTKINYAQSRQRSRFKDEERNSDAFEGQERRKYSRRTEKDDYPSTGSSHKRSYTKSRFEGDRERDETSYAQSRQRSRFKDDERNSDAFEGQERRKYSRRTEKDDYPSTDSSHKRSYTKSRFEGDRERDETPYGSDSRRKRSFQQKEIGFSAGSKGRRLSQQKEKESSKNDGIRLNKYIANAGICSRREADVLIGSGAVSVNGQIVTEMGFKVQPNDTVNYGGERLISERKKYLLLNKPKGYITTVDDPQERKTVMMLVGNACKERIYPVGRLDRNTTGLLLFTNDGEMAKKLTHPSHGAEKIYHVELDKPLTKKDMQQILDGVELEDGIVAADDIQYVGNGEDKKIVGIQIHTGKNRIVRRIFESLGYEIYKLDRVIFAGLTKKNLPRGEWRFLTDKELAFLKMI